jgi:hypothetical protein
MFVLALHSAFSPKCTALEAQIRLLDAEILDLISDIAELEDRRAQLERQHTGLLDQLAAFAGQEGGL